MCTKNMLCETVDFAWQFFRNKLRDSFEWCQLTHHDESRESFKRSFVKTSNKPRSFFHCFIDSSVASEHTSWKP